MKKFINSGIQFFFFALVFYTVLLFFWGQLPYFMRPNLTYTIGSVGHMNTRIKEAKTVSRPDFLFLGSSHTYRGFDTRIFEEANYSTFNFGSSAQSPIQTDLLLNRYLEDIKPQTVIYEVYPGTFSNDGIASAIDIISNDKNDIHAMKMAFELNHIKVYNNLLYGMLRGVFNLDDDFEEPITRDKDT